jgi:hypothetical protein
MYFHNELVYSKRSGINILKFTRKKNMKNGRTIIQWSFIVTAALAFQTTSFAQDKTAKDFPKRAETVKLIELIVGTWQLNGIVDNAKNPNKGRDKGTANNGMQILEFDRDGRYKVNNSTNAVDSGSYRMNEQQGILYLESDADDISPAEWSIAVNKNVMSLTGRNTEGGNQQTKRFKYVYNKTKEGLETNSRRNNK